MMDLSIVFVCLPEGQCHMMLSLAIPEHAFSISKNCSSDKERFREV